MNRKFLSVAIVLLLGLVGSVAAQQSTRTRTVAEQVGTRTYRVAVLSPARPLPTSIPTVVNLADKVIR